MKNALAKTDARITELRGIASALNENKRWGELTGDEKLFCNEVFIAGEVLKSLFTLVDDGSYTGGCRMLRHLEEDVTWIETKLLKEVVNLA